MPIHRTAPLTFRQDSVDRGHPGVPASTLCGWKAELTLSRGKHVILVDRSRLFVDGNPATPDPSAKFRYEIRVV